jgi:hypothetical protein
MPKRNSTGRRPTDVNQLAHLLARESTEKPETVRPAVPKAISRIMAQMGRKGGLKGGKRRLETMTQEERSQIASDAAKARWAKKSTLLPK